MDPPSICHKHLPRLNFGVDPGTALRITLRNRMQVYIPWKTMQNPTGPCPGSQGGPRGVGVFLGARYHFKALRITLGNRMRKHPTIRLTATGLPGNGSNSTWSPCVPFRKDPLFPCFDVILRWTVDYWRLLSSGDSGLLDHS